jgi:hypothetical protein
VSHFCPSFDLPAVIFSVQYAKECLAYYFSFEHNQLWLQRLDFAYKQKMTNPIKRSITSQDRFSSRKCFIFFKFYIYKIHACRNASPLVSNSMYKYYLYAYHNNLTRVSVYIHCLPIQEMNEHVVFEINEQRW